MGGVLCHGGSPIEMDALFHGKSYRKMDLGETIYATLAGGSGPQAKRHDFWGSTEEIMGITFFELTNLMNLMLKGVSENGRKSDWLWWPWQF